MTVVVMLLTVVIFAAAVFAYRGLRPTRQCPTCRVDYDVVADAGTGPNLTYDVLACPRCANTATRVHGSHSHLAYCPACQNRSLETPSVRTSREPLAVEVRESCHLCGFQRTYEAYHETPGPLGKVIPFPARHERPSRADADEA